MKIVVKWGEWFIWGFGDLGFMLVGESSNEVGNFEFEFFCMLIFGFYFCSRGWGFEV